MQGRARHRERTVRRRHLGSGGRPQTPEPDCGPRTQIACHAITANECRRQRVDGPAGYGLPLRHARPGELTCRYGITAGQEHIRGAAAPLPGTSRCEESANRVFSTLHNMSYRRSTHGSSCSCWNSRLANFAVVPRFAADVLGRRAREVGVVDAGQYGELSFSERYARSTGLWNGSWSCSWALRRPWIPWLWAPEANERRWPCGIAAPRTRHLPPSTPKKTPRKISALTNFS